MSVPKQKRTKGSVGKRRSHHALSKIKLSNCPKCNQAVRPHSACPTCGTYKNRPVLDLEVEKKGSSKKQA